MCAYFSSVQKLFYMCVIWISHGFIVAINYMRRSMCVWTISIYACDFSIGALLVYVCVYEKKSMFENYDNQISQKDAILNGE